MATKQLLPENKMGIVDWYTGKNVLVTGGTGFMGKVLLEKMLRSLPNIGNIYIVVKEKRGVAPNKRIEYMLKLPLFNKLRHENPKILTKLIAVEGDVTMENMGIQLESLKLIQAEVSIVFHIAATLRLEASLKDSINQNLYGTKHLFDVCLKIKNLQVVLHLSTAFCHCDYETLNEQLYPATHNPNDIMNIVKWMDDTTLEKITPNIIQPHPNTYTFTKRLSETIASDYGHKLPVVIVRPSIVVPTIKEPIPGWVDSLNGPVGVLAAGGKGVIRSMLVEASNHAEIIPADIAINAMLLTAWCRSTQNFKDTPVFNVSQSEIYPITWGEVLEKGKKVFIENPFDWPLWYPDGDIRTNKLIHYAIVILLQIIPAYFLDIIFMLILQKRFMVKIQNRIWLGMHLLQYFTLREWKIKNDKFLALIKRLNEQEMKIFYIYNFEINVNTYLKDIILGTRAYCLKEDPKTLPQARRYIKFLYVLDRLVKGLIIFGLFYTLLKFSVSIQVVHDAYYGIRNEI